ncbi:MAG: type II toxin-antitoxin system VapC family toxin [Myxococcaceae bacterium]|nr:type II toxin-antitoxin system VapC family toxin [Myxococcaceae bacterium]
MDPKLLPKRALIDTGVFIRALGEHPNDPRSADCKDFVDAMVAQGNDVLVAAPSLAEMIRGLPVPQPPSTGAIIIVAFDDQAAVVLGMNFPVSALKKLATDTGKSITYLKYDALIGACAVRHKADFLITIDGGFSAQVPKSLKVAAPSDFRTKQMTLVAVPAAPAPTATGSVQPLPAPKTTKKQ